MSGATGSLRTGFQREGYAVLPGWLDEAATTSLRESVDDLCAQVTEHPDNWNEDAVFQRSCSPGQLAHLSGAELAHALAKLYIVGNLTQHLPAMARVLLSPRFMGIAAEALGEPVRFHFSNVTIRAARLGCGNAWHRDFPNGFCCGADTRQLRLLLCLDGMSGEQGAVRVVAGSNRWTQSRWNAFMSGQREAGAEEVRTLECPPGSVVALHCRTAHSVLPNRSGRPRANVIAQYGARSNPLAVGEPELDGWPDHA